MGAHNFPASALFSLQVVTFWGCLNVHRHPQSPPLLREGGHISPSLAMGHGNPTEFQPPASKRVSASSLQLQQARGIQKSGVRSPRSHFLPEQTDLEQPKHVKSGGTGGGCQV